VQHLTFIEREVRLLGELAISLERLRIFWQDPRPRLGTHPKAAIKF